MFLWGAELLTTLLEQCMKGKSCLAKVIASIDGMADNRKAMDNVSLLFSEVYCPVSHNIFKTEDAA